MNTPPSRGGTALLAALLGLLGTICGAAGAQDAGKDVKPPEPVKVEEQYKLRAGDELVLSVRPQTNYDCAGIVLPDGMLFLKSLTKGIRASGLAIPQLVGIVKRELDEVLVKPGISIAIVRLAPPEPPKQIERVTVVGAVLRPGAIELEPGLRVRKAIDNCGGFAKDADLTKIVVIHPDLTRDTVDLSSEQRIRDALSNLELKDGDSIDVPLIPVIPVQTVRIGGQVLNPAKYELKEDLTLEELITVAGKATQMANIEEVELLRRGEPLRVINLWEQRKLGIKGDVFLKDGDHINVPQIQNTIYVIGAVLNPGPQAMKPGQTIREALFDTSSGYVLVYNPKEADVGGAQLIRRSQPGMKINLNDIVKDPKSKHNILVQSGDVIYLPPKREKKGGILGYIQQLGPLGYFIGAF